ncbi:hypothetical protein [Sediminicoccus sp. BL-A-41-H5]|uniref:hypothetical protein n=1 Tax=Sediminicoccus sp. BL-A-41-H5 TaxID=3421106 RepID=UPI003D665343
MRALLLLLLFLASASAETLRIGPPAALPALPELVLTGENQGTAPALPVLRVDDRASRKMCNCSRTGSMMSRLL